MSHMKQNQRKFYYWNNVGSYTKERIQLQIKAALMQANIWGTE